MMLLSGTIYIYIFKQNSHSLLSSSPNQCAITPVDLGEELFLHLA